MATSSSPAWVAKNCSLNFIPLSLIADKHLALTFSKIMNLPVTGNFRPILTSICRFSASYKASYSFLKSSVVVATKLHWLHSALAGLDSACVLVRRVKSTHPRARLSASGKDPQAERLACPSPHAPGSATATLAPSIAPFRQQSLVALPN